MLWYGIGLIAECLLLFLIARRFTEVLFLVVLRIVRIRSVAITIMTILLFPGTVIHELSHLFTAEVLGVRTGELSLAPESIDGESVRSGSVAIAKTDPFRRTLIGTAPFFNGILALFALSLWFTHATTLNQWILVDSRLTVAIIFYLMLTITNTMFTSKEDMVGVVPVAITIAILVLGAYIAGLRLTLPVAVTAIVQSSLVALVQNLGIVVLVNIAGLILCSIFVAVLRKRS